jgi:hypothetical protein
LISEHSAEIKSEFPFVKAPKFPSCPCIKDDDVVYEVFIWDFIKKRYIFISRTTICRKCDETTNSSSSVAIRLAKVIFNKVGYPSDLEMRCVDLASYGYPEMISLAAVASTFPNSEDVYIQAN